MSFLNSFRFGRSSKKTKPVQAPVVPITKRPSSRPAAQPQAVVQKEPAVQAIAKKNHLFMTEPYVRTALVKGSFKTIVQLPKYVDVGEWISLNMFELSGMLNSMYDALEIDNAQLDSVLSWINDRINDPNLFPTKFSVVFNTQFQNSVMQIAQQMFKVFEYIYLYEFEKILHLSLEAHWNSFFAHFVSFGREFQLVDFSGSPLLPLIENMEQQGKITSL